MSGRSDDGLLLGMLAVAVMAAVDDLRWTDEEIRLRMLRDLGYPDTRAEHGTPEYYAEMDRLGKLPDQGYPLGHGDALMFGGTGCVQAFASTARALALLAYGYGGVTFGPLRWCASHMRQRWTQADGQVCPSCLRDEEARLTSEGEQHAA